jgi:SAM-dependent methyltransferase
LSGNANAGPNWFDHGGSAYALFRPDYPDELSRFLSSASPAQNLAIDVGCGTGQLTRQIAEHFGTVIGIDSSADQIAHAVPQNGVEYHCAPAEDLPVKDSCVDLVTVAQAAHWLNRPAFYRECRRVTVNNALIALISYGVLRIASQPLQDRFSRFYWDEIGPYWPPERKLVDSGYADIDFPFEKIDVPAMQIERIWGLNEFLGYIATWSAVRRANDAGRADILDIFGHEISALWGDPEGKQAVSWPINMQLGRT